MKTLTFSQTRQHLAETMDHVTLDHTPVTITRQNKEAVVIISLNDYKSMQETAYLMQSTANANKLNSTINQLESGEGNEKELFEI